ncbi:MAG: tetratricopeptide repeat protein [Acidobacteria bacterium]|nr:tetratricopeptide repeat protein [Acidobacteriota bacterium]
MTRRRVWGIVLVCLTLSAGLGLALLRAQTPASSASPRTAALTAFRAGQFADVERLAQAQPADESLLVLRALSARATGDYARAESLLQPAAVKAPSGEAALELGLLQLYLGKRGEARRALQQVYGSGQEGRTAPALLRAARAARALGRFEDANAYFREADSLSPDDADINAAWGDLFLEKHERAEAAKSYGAALKADESHVPALIGMAQSLVDDNPGQALAFVNRALKIDPASVPANLLMAESAISRDRKDEARERLGKARGVNAKSLEVMAYEGALAYVEGKTEDFESAAAAALAINPTYGEFYRIVGSVTAGYYRFDEAAEHVRKGLQVDRENWRAYADLGTHLMRTGDERGARRMLETAFRQDPYDVITYNLLGLLDTLDKFDTVNEGEMVIRLHPDETGVMSQYVPALAREALDSLSKTWEFTPQGPILIEMFPRHDDFAVRNLGLPGMIGALGACFGRVVTLDSPKARPPGEFNWGVTLWHEIAHVITLQLSEQRVPRWLTEGTSVFEEKRARPEWGREMDLPFARALDRGQVFKLKDLNSGFTNPETISMAYFQSSLVVEHIVEVYGQPKLRALVQSYATGIDTETAFKQVLGVDIDVLQGTFDQFIEKRYGALRTALKAPEKLAEAETSEALRALVAANPGSFPAHVALGRSLEKTSPEQAIEMYEKAASIVPHATGPDSPQARIAELALARGDTPRAITALDTLTGFDHSDIASARKLASLLDATKQPALLRTALKRAVAVDPFDAASHTTLGRLALADEQPAEAVRMFRVALAARPVDRAGAHADLAEGLLASGDRDGARREALAALEVAPTYPRAQDLLLKLVGGR